MVYCLITISSNCQQYSASDQAKLDSLKLIAQSSAHDTVKTATYHAIGLFHYYKGEYKAATVSWSNILNQEEQLGNKNGMASSLNSLGIVYQSQGEIKKVYSTIIKA